MSYDPDEAAREEAEMDFIAEISIQAVNEHSAEKLRSYFLAHPHLSEPALAASLQADKLAESDFIGPALVSAVTAIEIYLKDCIVKPIIFGLIHTESLAQVVCDVALGQTGYLRYEAVLKGICTELLKRDIGSFRVPDSGRSLWEDAKHVQTIRNRVVHAGHEPFRQDMELAIKVAAIVSEQIWVPLLVALQLRLHPEQGHVIEQRNYMKFVPPLRG